MKNLHFKINIAISIAGLAALFMWIFICGVPREDSASGQYGHEVASR